ncbi:hypothetical protein AX16_009200 [Volvariella volvacea WC 439]|nr:hypothetical protein AX16_009200 [Volvariella volvacea WC 439]
MTSVNENSGYKTTLDPSRPDDAAHRKRGHELLYYCAANPRYHEKIEKLRTIREMSFRRTLDDSTPTTSGVAKDAFDIFPAETWGLIIECACIDGGPTGRSLSLVSHNLNLRSQPFRYQSLKIMRAAQLACALVRLRRDLDSLEEIKYLFVTIDEGVPSSKAVNELLASKPCKKLENITIYFRFHELQFDAVDFLPPLPALIRLTIVSLGHFYPLINPLLAPTKRFPSLLYLRFAGNVAIDRAWVKTWISFVKTHTNHLKCLWAPIYSEHLRGIRNEGLAEVGRAHITGLAAAFADSGQFFRPDAIPDTVRTIVFDTVNFDGKLSVKCILRAEVVQKVLSTVHLKKDNRVNPPVEAFTEDWEEEIKNKPGPWERWLTEKSKHEVLSGREDASFDGKVFILANMIPN